jgi:hypothetical protein
VLPNCLINKGIYFKNKMSHHLTSKGASTAAEGCKFYLAPSTISGAGRGIFAGEKFLEGTAVDVAPTLPIHHKYVSEMQLLNYVYGTNDDQYSMVIFGQSNLYNHRDEEDQVAVHHEWLDYDVRDPQIHFAFPQSDFTNVKHLFKKNLAAGDEIFTTYGDGWWDKHNMKTSTTSEISGSQVADSSDDDSCQVEADCNDNSATTAMASNHVSMEYLDTHGHCLSQVYADVSKIPFAGKGLFAGKRFMKGSVVTISPVLTLPKSQVESALHGDQSLLINYCISTPHTEMMLFPLSLAAMINHNSSASPANVRPMWYNWETRKVSASGDAAVDGVFSRFDSPSVPNADKDDETQTDTMGNAGSADNSGSGRNPNANDMDSLFHSNFAQYDLAYVAQQDIDQGDELTMNYGSKWDEQWLQYSKSVIEFLRNPEEASYPLMHMYMEAPTGLFPTVWFRNEYDTPMQ